MNRIEIKNFAKEKIKGRLWDFWKIALVAMAATLGLEFIFCLFFHNPDIGFIGYLLEILLLPLSIGLVNFMINFVNDKDFAINDLFNHYKNFLKVTGTLLLEGIIICLGFILFIIPGIYLTFSYMLVPYLLVQREDLSITDTLSLSRKMMNGHKLDALVFGLSFIGWIVLGTFTLGILYVWLSPYMSIAYTKFCLNIIENYKED
ncbi:MAG: DUF975 family protein [Bacilli bacterium]